MQTLHKAVFVILKPLVRLFFFFKFGYTCEKAKNLPDHFIVLANHTTDFDPLFVALGFREHMYFVASEHVARWGFAYTLLKIFLAPILRYKGSVASTTVKEILTKVRGGHNVALFAEGSRSWDGRTGPILPSTGKLVQKSKCGLVTFKITGGYFTSPRWSEGGTRKGPIHGAPVNVYTAEQLAAMTPAEVNEAICRDLWEDAYERQLADPKPYKSKHPAQRMENLLFLCPECGGVDTFRSEGSTVTCSACGMKFGYNEYGMLENAPVDTVRALSDWQKSEVGRHAEEAAVYTSENGQLISVANSVETPVAEGPVSLSGEALTCGGTVIPLCDISEMDIHGKHGLVFTAGKTYYELKPSGNALKFFLLYQAYTKAGRSLTAAGV